MYKYIITSLFIILITVTNNSFAKVRGSAEEAQITSRILDEKRELLIRLPNNYHKNKDQNYPVLYLTDGLRNFNHAVGSLDLLIQSYMAEDTIIVAIKNTHRTRDYTPTYDESYNRWGVSGGADNYLDFLEKELIPYINANYRTNNYKILSGHSLGGLLVVYSLQSRPHLFQAHFAFSPSLWWHNGIVLKEAEQFFKQDTPLNNYLYVNLADEGGHMRTSFDKFREVLAEHTRSDFQFNAELIEAEDHGTIAMVGHPLAYKYHYQRFTCPDEVVKQGVGAIETFYKKLSKKHGIEIKPQYDVVKHAAYYALNNKEFDQAISIFELNVNNYPYMADSYSRLAYAYEAKGDITKALALVNKALDMSLDEHVENNAFKTHKTHLLKTLNIKE